MTDKKILSQQDILLFKQQTQGTRRLRQDTVLHIPERKNIRQTPAKRFLAEQRDHCHYFSDEFQPRLNEEGPVRYVRADVSHFELKKLRRGDYTPEIFLDLHGLTQRQAKQELTALIAACRHERLFCASVMHGYGKHILNAAVSCTGRCLAADDQDHVVNQLR